MSRDIKEVAAGLGLATSIFKDPEIIAAMRTQAFIKPNASYIVSVDIAKSPFGISGPLGSFSKTAPDTGGVPF